MKWLSAILTFVNLSAVCGLLLGMAGRGLNVLSASLALVCGAAFAVAAYLGTSDGAIPDKAANHPAVERKRQKPSELESTPNADVWSAIMRYRRVWFWAVAVCFAIFAVRSFCWLLYIDGSDLRIQSPNNLGDLSLHITLIRNFANGVPLWPDNPIYVFSKVRYPAGIDLFNALLYLVHVDLLTGLVWTGLIASLVTFYAFFRWGGTFAIAGFLFNGGIAGFQFFKTLKFLDYQGDRTIAWKSIALSMFVTQRGWLYAIPAALVLLWHWREKFFAKDVVTGAELSAVPAYSAEAAAKAGSAETDGSGTNPPRQRKGPLPFWVELSLYASMPLFHLHTFLALTIVLLFALLFERPSELAFIVNLAGNEGIAGIGRLISRPTMWPEIFRGAPIRRHAAALLATALIPASFFVWLVSDRFRAASILQWHPGWAQDSPDFAAPFFRMGPVDFAVDAPHLWLARKTWNSVIAPFFQFWLTNFGLWIPLALALVGVCVWRAWKAGWRWGNKPPADIAFVLPAVAIFAVGYFFKTAPWDWDNLKLMVWGYFLILPFLWSDIIGRWAFPERAAMCIALFGSGFVTLLGGLSAGHPGFGIIERARLDAVGTAVQPLPVEARFAAYPTYNHPLLLQGRKVVLGYPGHLWTEGFDYGDANNRLTALMNGAANWRDAAQALGVRYVFWGQEEKTNYQSSSRPWEATAFLVASGDWGAIYDLKSPAPQH
jgi:hypothetical protein